MITFSSSEVDKTSIASSLDQLHPVLQRVYASRQIKSLQDIDYNINHLLHFKALKNIDAAAALLANAIQEEKQILIVGDFDTDGATSTALVVKALTQFGAEHVKYLIPNRFKYGYGLSPEIVAVANQPDLIMTVDNGISSYEGVRAAQRINCKVLITDHHTVPETLPPADVIVNPRQADDQFISKHLAGVGVAFYVMLALRHFLKDAGWFDEQTIPYPNMDHLLDLVALGTVADMVPLDFNNRILVYRGLQKIRSMKTCIGIQALAEIANYDLSHCTASALGFFIAPRLNAAGRMQDMSLGVECLLSQNKSDSLILANQLNTLNKKRRFVEEGMQNKAFIALNSLKTLTTQNSICLFDAGWHEGITGLVAGRIKERLHKPTIIFAPSQQTGKIKGSARSIPGVHIRDLLANIATQYPHILSHFGGHAAAAGLSLDERHYQQFTQLFEQHAKQAMCNLIDPICQTDGTLNAEDLNLHLALLIRESGPWGQGFPEPIFEGYFQILSQRIVGARHLQMALQYPKLKRPLNAILFNADLDKWPNLRIHSAQILYKLMVDSWEGRHSVKLQIEKLQH